MNIRSYKRKKMILMKTNDIETERLIIRSMTLDGADFAAKLWGDPETGKYLADPPYKNGDELREIISDIDEWEDEYPFIAYDKNTGDPIGTCSVGVEGSPTQWGFGYDVRKDLWGEGYATEMVMAMIDFAHSLGIRDFQGTVATENVASCRVMEKCGLRAHHTNSFKKQGTDIEYQATIFRLHLD